jgi:RNA polymerase sigma factor for flagellar operon FliA
MITRRRLTPAGERLAWRRFKQHGDQKAREALAEHHAGLVAKVALRYKGEHVGLSFDDMLGIGYGLLLTAIDTFDAQRGFRFSTYAVNWMSGRMRHAIRDASPLPAWALDLRAKAHQAELRLLGRLLRQPTTVEIAKEAGLTEAEVLRDKAWSNMQPLPLSQIEAERNDPDADSDAFEFESVGMADCALLGDPAEIALQDQMIDDVLKLLGARERPIVRAMVVDGATITETARTLSMSPQAAYERLKKLRRRVGSVGDCEIAGICFG